MLRRFALVLVVVGVALAASAPAASAQSNCVAFRGIGHGEVPSPAQLNPLDVWGGRVYASLGAANGADKFMPVGVPLAGVFSGQDADSDTNARLTTWGGMGLHGSYTFAFGDPNADWTTYTDKFTVSLGRAVWTVTPGTWVGDYKASGNITSGSGMFAKATGTITIHGPFFFAGPFRWSPEVEGTICGVK